MRAPIEPGNPGWDPDHGRQRAAKVGAALRAAGFIVIVVAFLAVSQQYVGGGDDDQPTSAPATVYAVTELKAVLPQLQTGAAIRYGTSVQLRQLVAEGAKTDVFVGRRTDAETLSESGRCSEPAAITTAPVRYSGCVVNRPGGDPDAGRAFLRSLTAIKGRDALLSTGFDVPPR